MRYRLSLIPVFFLSCLLTVAPARADKRSDSDRRMLRQLDAPMLFVKRFNQQGIHIYDNFFKWRPGGGIYVIENPADPPEKHRVHALVGPEAPDTLGNGIYWDPEISFDATRVLFSYKPSANESTSIYEIGIDPSIGEGRAGSLRRVTDPSPFCKDYKGSHAGVHDMHPMYLPDGRIMLTSTRPQGLVPCANEGVNILHVMNADGSEVRAISVNNVNEFDPCLLPDGRILHGRWEYVDKTALTIQSLWTIFPDGTNETALYSNNMVYPEAVLDARPVPDAPHLIVASFTPNNSPPRGSIGMVNTRRGKNGTQAIFNFDHHDKPDHDRGNSCEPWPLSKNIVLYSGMPRGQKLNAIMLTSRSGQKVVVRSDPDIDLHDPMLIKPRPVPEPIASGVKPGERTGRFYVQDVYIGLVHKGVERGEVKKLRVIEETSRVSASPGGAMNQTFLMSGALAWSAKNYLGVVPVEPDGSAYFEAPAGRALYLQALDGEGRLVQSMRTFVQAAPGVTRSCIGCHEHKYTSPSIPTGSRQQALERPPSKLESESWGSGFIDYPSMVQPILDKHCVRCHGGEKGFCGELDLTGGWTEYFSVSYENLVSRRKTQVTASLIAGIDCMNGTSLWSARFMPPRSHGSGAAPLADVLASGHEDRIKDLSRAERDLLMAWIDTNGLYHGTWDYTKHGASLKTWSKTRNALLGEMKAAGCNKCHKTFESDWFNLRTPERSRILRAPLANTEDGYGRALCRDRNVDPRDRRIRILVGGRYHHAVRPLESFKVPQVKTPAKESAPVVTFASTDDQHYRAMLDIIRDGRRKALAVPRVDMPGAEVIPGQHRQSIPTPLPEEMPELEARVDSDGIVRLSWERSARTIGLTAAIHRGAEGGFTPTEDTLIASTPLFEFSDTEVPTGPQHYALVLSAGGQHSRPVSATVTVPEPVPPSAPSGLEARSKSGRVALRWRPVEGAGVRYRVYRARKGTEDFRPLTDEPTAELRWVDGKTRAEIEYAYIIRAVSRRGLESQPSQSVVAAAKPEIKEPVFVAELATDLNGELYHGGEVKGRAHGKAKISGKTLDLRDGGYLAYDHLEQFDPLERFSVECWVRFDAPGDMPVVLSCGKWQGSGWFVQKLGGRWRWHYGGLSADGGRPPTGEWTHVLCSWDGDRARVYQDGRKVAEASGGANLSPWPGPMLIGQYAPGPSNSYQVTGLVRGVKVYQRTVSAEEAMAKAQSGPPKQP